MPRTYTIEDIAKLFDKLAEYDPHEWWPPIAIRNPEELERAVEGARTCLAATALTGVHLDNPR